MIILSHWKYGLTISVLTVCVHVHRNKHIYVVSSESCVRAVMLVAHLLRDGKAYDRISLRDVPCHNSRVCFHSFDGHIDRRRQAICKQSERQTSSIYLLRREANEEALLGESETRVGSGGVWKPPRILRVFHYECLKPTVAGNIPYMQAATYTMSQG